MEGMFIETDGGARTPLPVTPQGQPLLPSKGDIVFKNGKRFEVVAVEWDLDGLFVDVYGKRVLG